MIKNIISIQLVVLLIAGCSQTGSHKKANTIKDISMSVTRKPILEGKTNSDLICIRIGSPVEPGRELTVRKVELTFTRNSTPENLSSIIVHHKMEGAEPGELQLFGETKTPSIKSEIEGKIALLPGQNLLTVSFTAPGRCDLTSKLTIERMRIFFSSGIIRDIPVPAGNDTWYFGVPVRTAGQDSVHTYRIPGIITTNNGTLVAVYDARHNSSKDLQGDIDISMSRSTDGGQTWEPMRIIADMDSYGGRPEGQNGTGDPCILYDNINNTVWVAALWLSGSDPSKMVWFESKPGMDPETTGQIIMVKSTDDGLTWSEPVNITPQVKNPHWQLLLQGPGRGITTSNGTLVLPAQFKADIGVRAIDGGQFTCHSTIIYSTDGGNMWKIGSGAKANTTEAQVAELSDGSLMLNMRDDRNRSEKGTENGRAVAVTANLGKTWTPHSSTNSKLPEPNCMASLISTTIMLKGEKKNVLFFSNPADKSKRTNLTIKASLDEGITWPEEYQLEIYEPESFGYSCLTMVDDNHLGILYEGSRELYFQKFAVSEILNAEKR